MAKKTYIFLEYCKFLEAEERSVPKTLHEKLIQKIEDESLKKRKVITKFFITQLFVGLLTLIFCPQIKFSITHDIENFHYIHHHYGANICSFICGVLFLGIGSVFGLSIISSDEIRQIQDKKYVLYAALTAILSCSFIVFGIEEYSVTVLIWALGAYLGLLGGLKLNVSVRKFFSIVESSL